MTMTKTQFIHYLRETLIPDLMESGTCATAADFEAACRFIEGETHVKFPDETEIKKFVNNWRSRP